METQYLWWLLVWIVIVAMFTELAQLKVRAHIGDTVEYHYRWPVAIAMFFPIIILAARRTGFGDTEAYRSIFRGLPSQFSDISQYMQSVTKDRGFTYFSTVLKCLIGEQDVLFFFLIAALCGGCIIYAYKKYSCSYALSIFLFVASGDYLQWMFNGMRQFIAAAVLFACLGLLLRKRYLTFIAIVLLMATIHASALLLIPIIFVVQGKAWNKRTLLFLAVVIIAVVYVDHATNLIATIMDSSQYANETAQFVSDTGTSIQRVAVYAVPALIALWKRKEIRACNNRLIDLCVNMSIVSMGFYVVSMVTSGIFVGRIPIYFSLYNYILLPWELKNLFGRQTRRLLYVVMVAGYLVFYYYQAIITWQM